MELLGLGLGEWALVLVILFVVMGPKEMLTLSRRIALGIKKIRQSDLWRSIQETERELRQVPQELMKETGLDELEQERRKILANVRTGSPVVGWEPNPAEQSKPMGWEPESDTSASMPESSGTRIKE